MTTRGKLAQEGSDPRLISGELRITCRELGAHLPRAPTSNTSNVVPMEVC